MGGQPRAQHLVHVAALLQEERKSHLILCASALGGKESNAYII